MCFGKGLFLVFGTSSLSSVSSPLILNILLVTAGPDRDVLQLQRKHVVGVEVGVEMGVGTGEEMEVVMEIRGKADIEGPSLKAIPASVALLSTCSLTGLGVSKKGECRQKHHESARSQSPSPHPPKNWTGLFGPPACTDGFVR